MMQFVELVPEVQSLAEAADAAPPGTTVWKRTRSNQKKNAGADFIMFDAKWPCLTTLSNLTLGLHPKREAVYSHQPIFEVLLLLLMAELLHVGYIKPCMEGAKHQSQLVQDSRGRHHYWCMISTTLYNRPMLCRLAAALASSERQDWWSG